jgi:CubicO group peptidase (beta-lactamase class C family)
MPDILSPREILENGVAAGAFPGAVCHLSRGETQLFHDCVGTLGYNSPFGAPVTLAIVYDLASITKIYTLAAVFCALRDARIEFETPLQSYFATFDSHITLEHLMAHASGICFPIQALENVAASDWIEKIAIAPRENEAGKAVHYSCTNYFLLARVAEKVSGATLDELIRTRILRPLQLENTGFELPDLEIVAPTEQNEAGFWRGVVHDEAARSWRAQTATCAGNAGLFATCADVARFAQIWTQRGAEILHPEDVARTFATRFPENTHGRGLGFQLDALFT